jgi:hypothetical protein
VKTNQAEEETKRHEERRVERVVRALPVKLGRKVATTRDISNSGIFLELQLSDGIGIPVSFSVELETPSGKMTLKCEGEIVRVEPGGESMGLAVKITDSVLEQA